MPGRAGVRGTESTGGSGELPLRRGLRRMREAADYQAKEGCEGGGKEHGAAVCAHEQELSQVLMHLRMGKRCHQKDRPPKRGLEGCRGAVTCVLWMSGNVSDFGSSCQGCAKLWDPKSNTVVLAVTELRVSWGRWTEKTSTHIY